MTYLDQQASDSSHLASQLREKSPEILRTWEEWVRKEHMTLNGVDSPSLKNSLPEVINYLADVLDHNVRAVESSLLRDHGVDRANYPDYTIDQMISEYNFLRKAIFHCLNLENISDLEKEIIIEIIEEGTAQAALGFAKKQFEMREKFISTLAHDLRNPLTAAKTSAQMIMRVSDKEDKVKYLSSKIVRTIDRADHLISDLLDSNLVRLGKALPVVMGTANLNSIIRDSIEEVSTVYGNRIEYSYSEDIRGFWDSSLLQRAISNLLINAAKYGEAKKKITVWANEKNSWVNVSVHNYGGPISHEDQKHIFDRFYQKNDYQKSKAKGWGIGLYLVKGAVEAHGGSVCLDSNQQTGTTFTICIPKDSRH
jgi:signal transduction histidine kinase